MLLQIKSVPLHRLKTGFQVEYKVENEGGTAQAGLISGDSYFVRAIDDNTLELYDTAVNALSLQTTTGRRDLGDPVQETSTHSSHVELV